MFINFYIFKISSINNFLKKTELISNTSYPLASYQKPTITNNKASGSIGYSLALTDQKIKNIKKVKKTATLLMDRVIHVALLNQSELINDMSYPMANEI